MCSTSPAKQAEKSMYESACLSPQLSEMLYATCRLANSNTKAMSFLSRSIRSMYKKVCEICRESGFVSADVQDVLKDIDRINSVAPLNPSPRQKERVDFLEKVCSEEKTVQDPFTMSGCGRNVYKQGVRMVDAIELNHGLEQKYAHINAVVSLKSVDELGLRVKGDPKEGIGMKLDLPVCDEPTTMNPKAESFELPGDIMGDQIEVYSVTYQEWRIAVVSGKLSDGRHVLNFNDGVVEHVMLYERLWRPVA